MFVIEMLKVGSAPAICFNCSIPFQQAHTSGTNCSNQSFSQMMSQLFSIEFCVVQCALLNNANEEY